MLFFNAYVFDPFLNACFCKTFLDASLFKQVFGCTCFFNIHVFWTHAFLQNVLDMFLNVYVFDTFLEAFVISAFLNAYAVFKYIFRCIFFLHILDAYAFFISTCFLTYNFRCVMC